ncbi:MAG: tetratricopeptide repeat protein [Gemmatimonadota bacterium]|nr:tetratricopeptide repeat protein [Gemmatimonadota bacterium]
MMRSGADLRRLARAALAVLLVSGAGCGREKTPLVADSDIPTPGITSASDSLPVSNLPPDIVAYLDSGRWWRASRALAEYLQRTPRPSPDELFLAARAEAGWGGWSEVVRYLEGQPWLDQERGGEGWFWLARGLEETGRREDALSAYERYLTLSAGREPDRAAIAGLRRALILLAKGEVESGAALLEGVQRQAPYAAPRIDVLAAEALAAAGDTAGVRRAIVSLPAGSLAHRGNLAIVKAYAEAHDTAGAIRLATAARSRGGTPAQRAALSLALGRLKLGAGDETGARTEFLAAISGSPESTSAREAANLVSNLRGLTAADRLAIADVYRRHGNYDRAVAGYRAWLAEASGVTAAERDAVQLRLGRSLYDAGNNAAAETELKKLYSASPAVAREAMLYVGRAQNRRGDNAAATRTFDELATRFPGSAEGAEGLFLVADLNHDAGNEAAAMAGYRRVANEFPGTDRGGLSRMRLAGLRWLAGDYAGAAEIWEGYRQAHPEGSYWLQSTYWAGRAYEAAGDQEKARDRFEEVRRRDPLSYYAVMAAPRMQQAWWPVEMPAGPAPDSATILAVAERVRTVDLLREAGLYQEAEAEALRLADDTPATGEAVDYALAEALNERGYSIRGIAIGQRMQRNGEKMNTRLLRILYPFPFREMIEAEARERGLDPFVVAGLARQESQFTPRISSPVGARGLMQVMPATGATLARGAGISGWNADLLFEPEINTYLGILYLADQMRSYGGSFPSVFSAYNAGPHRVEAWKRFVEYSDPELFTERIPYRETRDYVKILTRNIEIYRGLYGDAAPAGDLR